MTQLILGDCLEKIKEIPDGKIDLIVCDMPYGILNRTNPHAQWDNEIDMDKMWPELWRVCKDNGAVVLFGQGMFSAKIMMSQPKYWRYNLIWDKINRPTGFLDCRRKPLRIHEDIMVFYRKQPVYNPQMTYGNVCHKRGKAGKNRCYGSFEWTPTVITNEKYPTSIVKIEKEHKQFYHGTQKPVALMEWIIKTYSNEGDTVLDFCAGSGSTGVAAVNTNRNFIGVELNEEYYEIAKKRIHDAEVKPKQIKLDL